MIYAQLERALGVQFRVIESFIKAFVPFQERFIGSGNVRGGPGKSSLLLTLAIFDALYGRDVWIIDCDPAPGITLYIDHMTRAWKKMLAERQTGKRVDFRKTSGDLSSWINGSPFSRSTSSLLDAPEKGIAHAAWEVPLKEWFLHLDIVPRPVTKKDFSNYTQRTSDMYGFNPNKIGRLRVIGASKYLAESLLAKQKQQDADPSSLARLAMSRSMDVALQKGEITPNSAIYGDTPGDESIGPKEIYSRCQAVFLPFVPGIAVDGMFQSMDTIEQIRLERDGLPAAVAIYNRAGGSDEEKMLFGDEEFRASFEEYGLDPDRYVITQCPAFRRSDIKHTIPFFDDPLEEQFLRLAQLYHETIGAPTA